MLIVLLEQAQQIEAKMFEQRKEAMLDAVESLPDLSLEVSLSSGSNFSICARAFPSTSLYKVCVNR